MWSRQELTIPAGKRYAGRPIVVFEQAGEGAQIRVPACIGGRYVVHGVLARGGMGAVLVANDSRMNDRSVLIKVNLIDEKRYFPRFETAAPDIEDELVDKTERLERERDFLLNLAEEMDRLPAVRDWVEDFSPQIFGPHTEGGWYLPSGHPGIDRLVDEQPYLVLQKIQGDNLGELLASNGPFGSIGSLQRARATVKFGVQICVMLQNLHYRRIPSEGTDVRYYYAYQDLKPGNLVITPADMLFLVDFGTVARVAVMPDGRHVCHAQAEGTRGYTAPELEQPIGASPGERTDLYSLGATLYHILTGNPPPLTDLPAAAGRAQVHPTYGRLPAVLTQFADPDPAQRVADGPGLPVTRAKYELQQIRKEL